MSAARPQRAGSTEDCLSDLAFDRLLSGELDGTAAETRRRAHIAGCALCAQRLGALAQQAAEFRRHAPPPPSLPRALRRAPRRMRVVLACTAAAAAAVMMLLFLRAPSPSDGLRRKGGLQLEVYVKHPDGAVEELLPGGTAAPGDRLGFRVSTAQAGFLALVSIDGAGTVSSYLPPAAALLPIPAGARQQIDGAIALDAVLGAERLIALLCSERLPVVQVLEHTRAALRLAGASPRSIDLARAGLDCTATAFDFVKAAPR